MSDEKLLTAADAARLAGVSRAAVGNWRRRHSDFPDPVGGSDLRPTFRQREVEQWLREQGKLVGAPVVDALWRALDAGRGDAEVTDLVAVVAGYLAGRKVASRLTTAIRELLDELGNEQPITVIDQLMSRLFERQQRQHLATPIELAELMVDLAEPISGTVFDPACGPGNVLRAAADRGAGELVGQEVDNALAQLAEARLRLARPARISAGDSLRADGFPDLRADAVLCDPPFGYRNWGHEELGLDPRWEYGFPVKGEPELAWLQHCLAHAKSDAPVVIVMPAGVAFRRSGRAIRQAMLRRGALRAVIALPSGVLMSTGIPIHLWVLRNPSEAGADPVLLVDTSEHAPERRGKVDWPAIRAAVLEPWRQFTNTGAVDPMPGRHRALEAIELLDEDVDLTPSRHLPVPKAEVDAVVINAEMVELARTLQSLTEGLPVVEPQEGAQRPPTPIGDLTRVGAVTVRQTTRRVELVDEAEGEGPLVLTARDLVSTGRPSRRLPAGGDPLHAVELMTGDVVTLAVSPSDGERAAVVIPEDGWLLGPHLQLVRSDTNRIDPQFLAGHLRARHAARACSSTASGIRRLDIRRVEIPLLNIDEQRRLGEQFARARQFEIDLRAASERGTALMRTLTDGVAEGALDLSQATKRG